MIIVLILELVVLFLLSKILTSELSQFLYRLSKSHTITIWSMALIFLPGTIIHEFSHAIMAKILFVYVGKMELMPQQRGETLKLGSVEVGKTDIVRNFLIGIAPFLSGTILLLAILYFSFRNNVFGLNALTIVVLYALFVIANTMYSSKKDMEGAIELFLVIVLPIVVLYFLGVRIPLPQVNFDEYIKSAVIFLGVPLLLDVAFITFAKIVRH